MPLITNQASLTDTRPYWRDSATHYGVISRALHWLTAAIVLFQFSVVLAWRGVGESEFTLMLSSIGPHGTLGILLLGITVLRAGWAWLNRHQRPSPAAGLNGVLARGVHMTFYALLIALPALSILRQYGRGGALDVYGIPLLSAAERDIPWMIELANLLHSPLAWLLLTLIGGHIAMALVHHFGFKDKVISRMAGPVRP
ncbi:cytochrome b [Halomonas aquamarina]|uniref:Cytochrome b n=1 Tax=Vreelandella aquamarina TaxID=77097 RepID=A0ACC5VT47_9GAMM|nr:cytochrome b [Halomonas aquamarina]MBZ5487313.1 cytochrome b [Halomonas aquamarina]